MPHFPHRAGNYVLFAELGSGTVGTTYIGRVVGQGRAAFKPLVVRILQSHLSQRGEIVRIFLDEQRAAALLLHPRIAAIHEVGVMPDGNYFLSAEFVHGVPLREVQRSIQAQLTPAQAVHVATQVCDALHHAHERLDLTGRPVKIIHGQLSPDSVILGFDGNVRVTEFGLLRTRDAAAATIPTLLQRRTVFLSPELRAQLPLRVAPSLDRRTDIYSIGAMLWEMLTGESLVPTEDGSPPPPPSSVRPVDPQLDAIVMRAMAKAPGDRFPTAQALRLALTSVAPLLSADSSLATGLARSLTVAFRERIVAFQEQLDLWRKFEDEVMPDAGVDHRRDGSMSGVSGTLSGVRRYPSGSQPGYSSSQSYPSLPGGSYPSGRGSVSSPSLPHMTPLPRVPTPLPGPGGDGQAKGRLFLVLLAVAIFGILLGGVMMLLKIRTPVRGALLIDSQPRGAQISVDGRPAGSTPHRISDLVSPSVHLEVRKDGYRPFVRDITPEPGKTVLVDVNLSPDDR